MRGRRSLVSLRSEAGDVAALASEVAEVKSAAEAGNTAAMNRADASMKVANTARSTANQAAEKAADADAKAADLQALADTVQATAQASAADRADLRTQLNTLVGSVASKASAESVSTLAADLSAQDASLSSLSGQVSALATSVAGKASQAAFDALTSTVAGKASQSALDALAASVGAIQTGLSSLATRVAALESRQIVAVRRARVTLPSVAVLATADVPITWSSPMPSASYSIRPEVEGAAGLGQLTASLKSQTATGCVITVKAAVALAAGQVLDVVAIHI